MYIHQYKEWPNFTWDEKKVSDKLILVSKAAGHLSGKFSLIGLTDKKLATVETITSDIVASSEIEGILLNNEQVRSSVARRMGVQLTNETEPTHYIDGIVEMMMDASNRFNTPLSDERLFGWHNCLFPNGFSGMYRINVGMYRRDPMDVVSGTFGREKVHYHAPDAEQVPEEMAQFINWFNSAETPKDYVKSAIAHFWFVSIHPFDDGNGRMGRAIADMALNQAENTNVRFFSMSRQINKEKRKYNEIIERCQKGGVDITQWIVWYLDCMVRCIESADEMLSKILNKAVFWQAHSHIHISERQQKMLNFYLDGYVGKLNAKNWAKQTATSLDTASRDIKDLVAKGVLVPQEGRARDVSYGISINDGNIYVPGPAEDVT